MRLTLAATAALAFAATTLPAHAAVYPVCATRLVEATTGTTATCYTLGPGPLGNRNVAVTRETTVEVAEGVVSVHLYCDNGAIDQTWTVSGLAPQALPRQWGGDHCATTLTALADHTSAVVASTFSFVIIID